MEHFQCLNGGIARPASASTGSSEILLECRCMTGFDGKYCEKDITSEATSMTVFQICLYIFLFIILPSIILYSIRVIYLILKRCGIVESPLISNRQQLHQQQQQQQDRGGGIQLLTLPSSTSFHQYQHLQQQQQPRPAFRTISLPVNATILVAAEPMIILEDGRRLHRTISFQPVSLHRTVSISTEPTSSTNNNNPPPSYIDIVKDQV
uniref:EGF-like domain-containing protein n=1 Tax=Panagrolaimus superbus TaxID=310955 RepID=A0A914YTQ9_9BILA